MVSRITIVNIVALGTTFIGFVWWNLQPDSRSLVSVGPKGYELTGHGPGWPFPAYFQTSSYGSQVPIDDFFKTPAEERAEWEAKSREDSRYKTFVESNVRVNDSERLNRWGLNGLFGLLLGYALAANVVRAYREAGLVRHSNSLESSNQDKRPAKALPPAL